MVIASSTLAHRSAASPQEPGGVYWACASAHWAFRSSSRARIACSTTSSERRVGAGAAGAAGAARADLRLVLRGVETGRVAVMSRSGESI